MRALEPVRSGRTLRDGVGIAWELFGEGDQTVFLLPTWSIIHARHWKMQVPYLARHCRVLVMDGRGNGASDRPPDAEAYSDWEFAADALAVMDDTGTERAALVSLSAGARWALLLAAEHPERVTAAVFIGPSLPLTSPAPGRANAVQRFEEPLAEYEGWAKYNANYWLQDHRGFLEFFFSRVFTERHSTKPIEDAVSWGLDTTPEVLVATARGSGLTAEQVFERLGQVKCPVLVLHGDRDEISPHERGARLAEVTGGRLQTFEGSAHCPHVRDAVAVNLAVRDFLLPAAPPARRRRALKRPRRALFVSSPIGLGHARRDVAIARALRERVPDLQIDWLAQDPVTRVLAANGETIHPASSRLASESRHIESEAEPHRLHVFQALRRMDEILLANFMVFLETAEAGDYDLWIGDEAWEVDYYLHENPELKRAAYVWLTDFVGWLPMPSGGEAEAALTADYNAEMIEHIARFPRVRDRSIFIGRPEDIVDGDFGPGLPAIREWTERHYAFSGGYILGPDGVPGADRGSGDRVCIATVGGSGVGTALLRRLIEAYPVVRETIPDLRLVAVAGPRIESGDLPRVPGVEVLGFVPDLDRELAACDVAITQGGLTTTMELTAARRPFLYFPLRDHFEQNFHVRHRLQRYRAGRCMNYEEATPEALAGALEAVLAAPVDYAPVETGTAARTADLIAELLV